MPVNVSGRQKRLNTGKPEQADRAGAYLDGSGIERRTAPAAGDP